MITIKIKAEGGKAKCLQFCTNSYPKKKKRCGKRGSGETREEKIEKVENEHWWVSDSILLPSSSFAPLHAFLDPLFRPHDERALVDWYISIEHRQTEQHWQSSQEVEEKQQTRNDQQRKHHDHNPFSIEYAKRIFRIHNRENENQNSKDKETKINRKNHRYMNIGQECHEKNWKKRVWKIILVRIIFTQITVHLLIRS